MILKNNGAISIFALLSMMFFLIFIMVAYNNVMQKGKTQVETEEILTDYYRYTQTANEVVLSKSAGDAILENLKDRNQKLAVMKAGGVRYIYTNNYVYKIEDDKKEYQELEYIESTEQQYIDSGVVIDDSHYEVDIIYQYTNYNLGGIAGCAKAKTATTGVDNTRFYVNSPYGSLESRYVFGNTTIRDDSGMLEKHELIFNNSNHEIIEDGNVLGNGYEDSFIAPNENLVIFGVQLGTNIVARANVKLYSMRIYHNEELIRDFIPCYRVSDNIAGLYDLIEDKFYVNNGEGSFSKGPVSYANEDESTDVILKVPEEIANKYITDGLLAMYDGKYNSYDINTGYCIHDGSNTDVWIDLVRRDGIRRDGIIRNFTIGSESYWVENGIHLSHRNDDGIYLGSKFYDLFKDKSATVEMLVKIDNTGQRSMFFGNYNASNSFNFEPHSYASELGWKSRIWWNGGSYEQKAAVQNLPYDEIMTVTLCYDKDANTITIYKNGEVTQICTDVPERTIAYNNVWIGRDLRDYTGKVQFGGIFYNIRIYDTVLTQEQIRYNATKDGTYGN